jgi:hypothetical protein
MRVSRIDALRRECDEEVLPNGESRMGEGRDKDFFSGSRI